MTQTATELYEEVGPLFGRTNTRTRPDRPLPLTFGPIDEATIAAARRRLGDRSSIEDLMIHGVRVRLFTNSHHLGQFARDHFWTAAEWRAETGGPLPPQPHVTVVAVHGMEDRAPAARIDAAGATGLLVNAAHFGALRALMLAAAGKILEEEYGILTLEAAAVGCGDGATILTGSAGSGRSALAYALLRRPETRFIADGAVHVRFMVPATHGRWVHPFAVGDDARVRVLRTDHQIDAFAASEVSTAEPPQPWIYPAEKVPYVNTNLAAHFPDLAEHFGASKLENVPAEGFAAAPVSRALLDVRRILGPARAAAHPLESARVACLFRLRRDPRDPVVAGPLSPHDAAGPLERRLMGRVPSHALNQVRPPQEMGRLIGKLLQHPPERLNISADMLDAYLR